jgi:WD40 repeat protein
VVIALLSLTATAFWVAWRVAAQQRALAELQRVESESRRLEAVSQRAESLWQGARADLRREDMLGARAKLRTALEAKDAPEIRALWWQASLSDLLWSRRIGADLNVAAASRDGSSIAVGTADGTVYLVDGDGMEYKALREQTDQITAIAVSDDAAWSAVGTWSGAVDVWHNASRKRTAIPGHRGIVRRIAFASGGRLFASGGIDRTLRIYDAQDGRVVRVIEGLSAEVRHLSFKPDATALVSADLEGNVQSWDVNNGAAQFHVQSRGARPAIRWTQDGRTLVVAGGGRALLIDGASGREADSVPTEPVVLDLAERDDGRMLGLVAAGPQEVRVTDIRTASVLATLPGGGNLSDKLTFMARGTRVLEVGEDQTLRTWRIRTPSGLSENTRPAAGPIYALAVSPSGSTLAAAGRTRTIQLLDTASGRLREQWPGHLAAVNELAFSRDGARVASASWDNSLRLWETDTRKSEVLWSNSSWPVVSAAFSPDGTHIAMASGPSGIRIVDLRTGAPRTLAQAHDYMVFGLDYSPNSRTLASAGGTSVRLWDATRDTPLHTLRGHQGTLRKVRFSPNGDLVASGADDGTVRLWETATGREVRVLGPQAERVVSLGFHPGGQRIGVTLSGGGVGVWDLQGRRVATMRGHRGDANTVVFAREGKWMITSGDDATIRAWDLESGRAAWFASAVVGAPPQAFTHEGWRSLQHPSAVSPAATQWRAAIERSARLARESADRKVLCLASHDDVLQGWNLETDAPGAATSVPLLRDVAALPGACAALAGNGEASLRPLAGGAIVLSPNATALSADGDKLLVAAEHGVRVHAADGRLMASVGADVGVTALARVDDAIAVGYRDGNIELLNEGGARGMRRVVFDDIPAVAVERIAAGPPGTLLAGFVNGTVGAWDLRTGAALLKLQLHGPVTWLACPAHTLHAVTELGDLQAVDLDVLVRDYCTLMREVWKEVPVVWSEGRAVPAEPPAGHRCRL